MLGPFLDSYELASNTQGLIYFAVSKKGESPIDGKTDLNPEGKYHYFILLLLVLILFY